MNASQHHVIALAHLMPLFGRLKENYSTDKSDHWSTCQTLSQQTGTHTRMRNPNSHFYYFIVKFVIICDALSNSVLSDVGWHRNWHCVRPQQKLLGPGGFYPHILMYFFGLPVYQYRMFIDVNQP